MNSCPMLACVAWLPFPAKPAPVRLCGHSWLPLKTGRCLWARSIKRVMHVVQSVLCRLSWLEFTLHFLKWLSSWMSFCRCPRMSWMFSTNYCLALNVRTSFIIWQLPSMFAVPFLLEYRKHEVCKPDNVTLFDLIYGRLFDFSFWLPSATTDGFSDQTDKKGQQFKWGSQWGVQL